MKDKYLNELRELMKNYDIGKTEMEEIIDDYAEMIDDANSKQMSEDEIIALIGSPEKVIRDLADEFKERRMSVEEDDGSFRRTGHKIIALMPFISVIIFFVLGFAWSLWHPGWMIFLAIPITAILVGVLENTHNKAYIALTPFIAAIVFMMLGFVWSLWHPGWLVFLIIPMTAIISSYKEMSLISLLTSISPFIALIIFIIVGTYVGYWEYAWLVFLAIPMIAMLHEKKLWKILVFEASMLIAIGAYVYLTMTYDTWFYPLFAFLIPAGVSILISEGELIVITKENRMDWIVALILIAVYIGFGVLFPST